MNWIEASFMGNSPINSYFQLNGKIANFQYPCADTTTCSPLKIDLQRGHYRISLFGAKGGNAGEGIGGKGAKASGILSLTKRSTFFLFIGGKGLDQ